MALGQTRVNGDATAVVATDIDYNTDGAARTASGIISPGLTGRITAYKINGFTGYAGSNLTLESGINRTNGNAGVVSRVLDVIQQRSTVVMYQVESASAQLSVLVERNAWTDADLQAYIRANIANGSGNCGIYGNTVVSAATVVSTSGFKLA